MPPEALKLLVDIKKALADIKDFTLGMDFEMYQRDTKCRAAVERKFEVIGEACMRMRDRCPEQFCRVLSGSQIIGFRNRLIHGYDNVDDAIVWDIVTRKLLVLANEVAAMMD